jgi:hypothetical protein
MISLEHNQKLKLISRSFLSPLCLLSVLEPFFGGGEEEDRKEEGEERISMGILLGEELEQVVLMEAAFKLKLPWTTNPKSKSRRSSMSQGKRERE